MADFTYTVDTSLLNVNNVDLSGKYTSSNIPIIRNGSRLLRLRKGTPSSYSEVIHKDCAYKAQNSYGINIQVKVEGWYSYWSCGYQNYEARVTVYFGTSASVSGDSVSSSNTGLYNDQTITITCHDKQVCVISTGNIRANTTYGGTVYWYDSTSTGAQIKLISSNDNSPIKATWSGSLGGSSKSTTSGWWNLGSSSPGVLLKEVSGNIGWTTVKSTSGTMTLTNNYREY